jgi:glycerol-3-phosphate dehydrogenase
MLRRAQNGARWDIIVVGGGATGLGTAVDAAARGYRTILFEAHDFAKGTSSRSTKLIHGGVRYLAQGQVGLVREALHERAILKRNAPHLVHDLSFVVPSYSWWGLPYYGLGLKVYDLLASAHGVGRSRITSAAEAARLAPTLRSDGLRGAVVYTDGQFDDARLAITLLRTFLDLGGVALNYAPVIELVKDAGKVTGVRVRNHESGEEWSVSGRAVVNATGVFADELRRSDNAHAAPMIRPSQGVHLVLHRSFLPGEAAILVPRTDDGRVLFVIPWHERAIVGTTDTPIGAPSIEPHPLDDEVQFLLEHAARYLNRRPTAADVLSVFTGLRPLVGSDGRSRTANLSREHVVQVSDSGLITIAGGKWTTYRRMGADAVDAAITSAKLTCRPCATERLMLHGGSPVEGALDSREPLAVYGLDIDAVRSVLNEQPGWDAPLHAQLPYLAGEVMWAARYELARTVEDVLARRTRALILDARASREIAPRVAELLAVELGQTTAWQAEQVRQYDVLARGYLLG